MEGILDTIGAMALAMLVAIGLVAGWIASKIAGGRQLLYMVVGVIAAVATPFVLAALGVGVLAAGGLLLLLVVAAIGAVIVLAIVRAIFGRMS